MFQVPRGCLHDRLLTVVVVGLLLLSAINEASAVSAAVVTSNSSSPSILGGLSNLTGGSANETAPSVRWPPAPVVAFNLVSITTAPTDTNDWSYYNTSLMVASSPGGGGSWRLTPGTTALTSIYEDDSVDLAPLTGFCFPFWSIPEAMVYVASNGFLSIAPTALCAHYCASNEQGRYVFSNTGGGDWPIIALYTADLDASRLRRSADGADNRDAMYPERGIYAQLVDRSEWGVAGGQAMVVEFRDVPHFEDEGAANSSFTSRLRAQVELWPNGTVILRYKSVVFPTPLTISTGEALQPGVGIILEGPLRKLAATPQMRSANGVSTPSIVAHRFDPLPDPCARTSACDRCSYQSNCTWCPSSGRCVNSVVASVTGLCTIRESVRQAANVTCGDARHSIPSQLFYSPRAVVASHESINDRFPSIVPPPSNTDYNIWGADPSTAVLRDASFTADYANSVAFQLANGSMSTWPIDIPLPFGFSLFNVSAGNVSAYSKRIPPTAGYPPGVGAQPAAFVTLTKSGTILLNRSDSIHNIIAPLWTSSLSFANASSTVWYALLKPRAVGSLFCSTEMTLYATMNETLSSSRGVARSEDDAAQNLLRCPAAVVLEFNGLLPLSGTAPNDYLDMSIQLVLDDRGVIVLRYLRKNASRTSSCLSDDSLPVVLSAPYVYYPPPIIGLLRNGEADLSSVLLPWPSLSQAAAYVFVPVNACFDCHDRGACNATTGTCDCQKNFKGATCDSCAAGYVGPACLPCPLCTNGGSCDDGAGGTGRCRCEFPFSGATCQIKCEPPYATQDLACPGCNPIGGVCECGVCKCLTQFGWFGKTCGNWSDPCLPLSLDGCDVCINTTLRESGLQCAFCSLQDYRCVSPNHPMLPIRDSLCAYGASASTATGPRCPITHTLQPGSSDVNIVIVVASFVLLSLGACSGATIMCCCRAPPPNALIVNATPGLADCPPPRREREIMNVERIDPRRQGTYVLGIPLKQVPLRTLHDLQLQQQAATPRHRMRRPAAAEGSHAI